MELVKKPVRKRLKNRLQPMKSNAIPGDSDYSKIFIFKQNDQIIEI